MRKRKGAFIVLEGTDGSGKTTQFNELLKRFKKEGIEYATFDFPQYEKQSSYFVREYLNGKYGSMEEVGPYRASIFYAMDRFDVGPQIKRWLSEGRVIVSNRYVTSNMGHQGAKLKKKEERKKLFKWLDELEYKILGIPRPTLTLILRVPAKTAQELVDKKAKREYIGGAKRDLHESDLNHLKQAEATYIEMVGMFPREMKLIECAPKGELSSIPEVHEKIWSHIKKHLAR